LTPLTESEESNWQNFNPDEVYVQRTRIAKILRPLYEPLVSDHIGRYYAYPEATTNEQGCDAFTWLCPNFRPNNVGLDPDARVDIEPIAAQRVSSHDDWANRVGKKTRNLVRKAERTLGWWLWESPEESDHDLDQLAGIIHKIYNETPTRQGMRFPHYGKTEDSIRANIATGVGEYVTVHEKAGPAVGFAHLIAHDKTCMLEEFLSLQSAYSQAPNNLLLSAVVQRCEETGWKYVTYGRIGTGTHPSLDRFKKSNGFTQWNCVRGAIGFNAKGWLAVKLGLHLPVQDRIPRRLIPAARRAKILADKVRCIR